MSIIDKYKLLSYEIEDLLTKIKSRDDLWIDLGKEKVGNDFPSNKINQNIKEKVDSEVLKREKVWDIINDTFNEHILMIANLNNDFKDCNLKNENNNILKGKNLTLERRYGIKEYDILLRKENIQLLYFGIITGTICILILCLKYFDFINLTIALFIYIFLLVIYVAYLVKIMVLDRVNRNSIYFHKYNFNKPTEEEIKKSREQNSENDNSGNSCKEDIYGRGSKSYQSQLDDPILDEIKANTELSAEKCLTKF